MLGCPTEYIGGTYRADSNEFSSGIENPFSSGIAIPFSSHEISEVSRILPSISPPSPMTDSSNSDVSKLVDWVSGSEIYLVLAVPAPSAPDVIRLLDMSKTASSADIFDE